MTVRMKSGREVRGVFRLPRKAFAAAFVASVVLVGSALWLASNSKSPLEQPIMEGQSIIHWLEIMATTDRTEEIQERLFSLGPRVIPPLLAALNDRPSPLKMKVTQLLGGRIPAFDRWLWRRPHAFRYMAAQALRAMPPEPRIRDELIRALRRADDPREDSDIGFWAAQGLGQYTNDPVAVVPALRVALRSPHHTVQAEAARALANFGTNGLVAVPDLIPLLAGTDDYLRSHTAYALGLFGPAVSDTLPAIRPLLKNKEPYVRRAAAVAIWRIAPETGFPADVLLENMKNGRLQERLFASQQLWELGHIRASEVVATLVELIRSGPEGPDRHGQVNHWHRWRAAQILGEMGAEAKAALPALVEAETDDGDEQMRIVTREAKAAHEQIEKALTQRLQTAGE